MALKAFELNGTFLMTSNTKKMNDRVAYMGKFHSWEGVPKDTKKFEQFRSLHQEECPPADGPTRSFHHPKVKKKAVHWQWEKFFWQCLLC